MWMVGGAVLLPIPPRRTNRDGDFFFPLCWKLAFVSAWQSGTPMEVSRRRSRSNEPFCFQKERQRTNQQTVGSATTPGIETKALLTKPAGERTGLGCTGTGWMSHHSLTSYSLQLPLLLISLKCEAHFRRHQVDVDLPILHSPHVAIVHVSVPGGGRYAYTRTNTDWKGRR